MTADTPRLRTYSASPVPSPSIARKRGLAITAAQAVSTFFQSPPVTYAQSVAFSVAGVLVVIHALTQLVFYGVWLWRSSTATSHEQAYLAQVGAEAILGGSLFLGAEGLSHFWHKLRTAGTIPPDSQ